MPTPPDCEHCQDYHAIKTFYYQEKQPGRQLWGTDYKIVHVCPACVSDGEKRLALLRVTTEPITLTIEELRSVMV